MTIIHDMPEAEYLAHGNTSHSQIEKFLRRRRWFIEPPSDEPSAAMLFGKYFHALVLEPDTVNERFVVEPRFGDGRLKATKEAKAAFREQSAGRITIPADLGACAAPMLDALREHSEAGPLLFPVADGTNEASVFWTDAVTGRYMKRRIDRFQPGPRRTMELKTTETLDPKRLPHIAHALGYHRAAAVTIDALKAETGHWYKMPFVFVSVEEKPMVCVWWTEPDSPEVSIGRHEYQSALVAIAECERSGDWRQPFEVQPEQPFRLPGWVMKEHEHLFALEGATPR